MVLVELPSLPGQPWQGAAESSLGQELSCGQGGPRRLQLCCGERVVEFLCFRSLSKRLGQAFPSRAALGAVREGPEPAAGEESGGEGGDTESRGGEAGTETAPYKPRANLALRGPKLQLTLRSCTRTPANWQLPGREQTQKAAPKGACSGATSCSLLPQRSGPEEQLCPCSTNPALLGG